MPTYEYECPKCEHRFEKFQSMNDAPVKTCPKCKSRRVKRLIGRGAGLIFRGSGFYQTDYRSDSYEKAAKADTPGADSKPEAKDGKAVKKTEKKAAKKSKKTSSPKGPAA